jgi:hypothetical protein
MNISEFQVKYADIAQKNKILINCDLCGRERNVQREKAAVNVSKYGFYKCRSCSMKASHHTNPRGDETKQKQREGRLGKKHSPESKKLMSESKKAHFQTEKGKENRKLLAAKAVMEHGSNKINKSKRKVLYISAKNNDIQVCNSSYEFVACEDFWEKDPSIKSYQTQVVFEIDGRHHSLDVLIEYLDGSKKVVEIKPKKRVCEFKEQIRDCKKYADSIGCKFELWTESRLNITSVRTARDRADEYRKTHYLIDYASYRQQKNRDKANRHYQNKVAEDKVTTYCGYCKEYHTQLRLTYERNVSKNGRFICIRENGSIIGKQPKKKANPYEELGQKQCKGKCARILPFDCFSVGKAICKECRAEIYKEKYQENLP